MKFLKRFNFVANQADKCVFISKVLGFIVMLAIFVDDGMVICVSLDEILELLTCLESEFDITVVSNAKKFVGLQICGDRSKKTLFIHQSQYTKKLL